MAIRWPICTQVIEDVRHYGGFADRRALVDLSARLRAERTRTHSLKQRNWPPAHGVFVMTKLARPITKDEVAAYNLAGVVLLRGILDLPTVNTLRRCIDEAVRTLQDSPSGYDLSLLTRAIENYDRDTLARQQRGSARRRRHSRAHFVDRQAISVRQRSDPAREAFCSTPGLPRACASFAASR